MNFLSATSICSFFDKDITFSNTKIAEEEENHSSSKKNNQPSEEEEYHYLSSFNFYHATNSHNSKNYFFIETNHSIKDDLVIKIPSPPPEHKL